jgi:hypothetical protein
MGFQGAEACSAPRRTAPLWPAMQECCQRLHKGALRPAAVTPEMMLRARYSAMALKNAWFLKDSRCGVRFAPCTQSGFLCGFFVRGLKGDGCCLIAPI